MPFGWSCEKGVSPWTVVTPDAIGYSKLIECEMISWPFFETRKARNFCAAAWCVPRLQYRRGRDVEHIAGVTRGEVGDLGAQFDAPSSARIRYQ